MKLDDYIKHVFIPVVKAYKNLKKSDESNIAWCIRNKIIGHACYAFDDYGKLYASKAAQAEYEKKSKGMIHDNEDVYYDTADEKGKQYHKYHCEHVFTNTML